MVLFSKFMDILRKQHPGFNLHLAPFERGFPGSMPLQSLGYAAEKSGWVRTVFSAVNFSFIFSGQGRYRWRGSWLQVQAPCVIIQTPGIPMEYGPEPIWEELFFIYDASSLAPLTRSGFLNMDEPMWPIAPSPALHDSVGDLIKLCQEPQRGLAVDKIDRLAHLILLESRKGPSPTPELAEIERIRLMAREIRAAPGNEIDWDARAKELGMHPSTFRRHWARAGYAPPAQFLSEARMRQACRLLAESSLAIGEIADEVGFDDQLHFSRRFKQLQGLSPSQYRKQHRILQPSE